MRRLLLVTPARSGTHIILRGLRNQADTALMHPQHHEGEWDRSREILYLERRDSHAWARSIIYNHHYRPHTFTGRYPDNLWTPDEQRISIEHQRDILAQQGPATLKPNHFKPMVLHWCTYREFQVNNPTPWPTLYYEDLVKSADTELSRWQLQHEPHLASVKTPKIPMAEAFRNPDEFQDMWHKWVAHEMNRLKSQ